MTDGMTNHVPLHDRLLARWEFGPFGLVPLANAVLIVGGMAALLTFATLTGIKPVIGARTLVVLWLVLAAGEIARFLWAAEHRYASPRWMRALAAVLGDELFARALADVIRQHLYGSDDVVTRTDMIDAVRRARAERRDTLQRAAAFHLVSDTGSTSDDARID